MIAALESWTAWAPVLVLALVLFVMFRTTRPVSADEARRLLQSGARVVDVRTPGEFASGSVRGAVNIPLGELPQRIHTFAPEKTAPLLLHCLSGGRSALAARTLRRLGYPHVYNLGSLRRARQIVES